MKKLIEIVKNWWNTNTGFRHGVTTWVGVQLAAPLAQILAWAQSNGVQPLPDWDMALRALGFATVAAVISGLIKWFQNRKAFPVLTK